MDKEVKCGDLFVVPKGYPVAKLAAKDDCFEMVAFTTCTFPLCMRLAGEKSVFHFLPKELFEAGEEHPEGSPWAGRFSWLLVEGISCM